MLQIRTNYTVGVFFKYERVQCVARHTSHINTCSPAVAMYAVTVDTEGENCCLYQGTTPIMSECRKPEST
jgi:hypothetical protein